MILFALLLGLRRTSSLLVLRTSLAAARRDDRSSPQERGEAQRKYGAVCHELDRRERARRPKTRARSLLRWGWWS